MWVLAFSGTPLVIEPSLGQLSGDAGLLPIRPFDPYIGLIEAFAESLDDPRDPDRTEHIFLEMVRSRGDDREGRRSSSQDLSSKPFSTPRSVP
jgi:hypothetical protein